MQVQVIGTPAHIRTQGNHNAVVRPAGAQGRMTVEGQDQRPVHAKCERATNSREVNPVEGQNDRLYERDIAAAPNQFGMSFICSYA
jgi:hypothetical protein